MPEWKRASDKSKKKIFLNEDNEFKGNSTFENNQFLNEEENEFDNYNEYNTNERKNILNKFSDDNNEDDEEINDEDDYEYDNEYNNGILKKIIIVLIVILLAIVLGYFSYLKFSKSDVKVQEVSNTTQVNEMIKTLDGFDVLGKVKIEKLNIEQYILDSTSEEALNSGVGKIENGGQLNGYGNFAIAGHNYEGVFKDLNTLVSGDEIILINSNLKETTYVVTNVSKVEPSNLTCLLQDNSKKYLTLITCEEGAQTRVVIKAEEKINQTSNMNNTNEVDPQDGLINQNTNG